MRALGGEMGGGVYGFGVTTCSLGQRIFGQVISSKSPDAEICEKRAHIVLILPTSLPQGTDGCEPYVHNCDRVKFMNGTLNDCMKNDILLRKKKLYYRLRSLRPVTHY